MNVLLKTTLLFSLFPAFLFAQTPDGWVQNEDRIQPWPEHSGYWQYKGEPLMLLGGSKTDHIFLAEGLLEHLDEIHATGANYVRNTMSQREEKERKPHRLLADGTYDLNQWNEDYWKRFEDMLQWTHERDIIVQIEVWDRFDFSRENWDISPWNPGVNVNYTYEQTGFDEVYPNHPNRDEQPFFHSIPGMPRYSPLLDRVRMHQERFVSKILSYSLKYGNVLYCMNNETSTPAEWGQYWINFIREKAQEKGVIVYATDMFNDAYKGPEILNTKVVFEDAGHYMFVDISQVNSRNFNEEHWEGVTWLIEQVNSLQQRPCNHTKIYGSGYLSFGTGGPEDGVERFWRNILAGSASSRFHRPTAGIGLNERARACIQAARLAEEEIRFWEIEPHMELLSDREPNEAYLAASPGEQYMLYFTHGGSVGLDLTVASGLFNLKWLSISEGIWLEREKEIESGSIVTLDAPFKGGWVAVLTKINP